MAAPTDNILETVTTYQNSMLGRLQNENCFIANMNTKFKDFQDRPGNLGGTVDFDLVPRSYANDGLVVASFDAVEQRKRTLTVDTSKNINWAMDASQLIFNIDNNDYRDKFEASAVAEFGDVVEEDIASQILPDTYRFYGNGVTPINSFPQLSKALAYFRNYGSVKTDYQFYLDDIAEPDIAGSGLSQFVIDRNELLASTWKVGKYNNCDFFRSNHLPIQTAGTLGEDGTVLTITSFVTDADGGVSSITCSGAGTDADAIKENDLGQFQDNVAGETNIRFRKFTGHGPSSNPVQIRATADAASSAGNVTFTISPKLYSAAGKNQNITTAVSAGMQIVFLPSHRAGLICSGSPLFLGMPALPDPIPFPSSNAYDDETGVSMRFYYGTKLGENVYGYILDAQWGKKFVDEQCMRVIFPV